MGGNRIHITCLHCDYAKISRPATKKYDYLPVSTQALYSNSTYILVHTLLYVDMCIDKDLQLIKCLFNYHCSLVIHCIALHALVYSY